MIRSIPGDFLAVLRDGVRIWWLAPLIPLLVVIPETIQHIVEIRIGMFESRAEFAALASDPRRMTWGVLKVVGLLLAILAAVRFWGAREKAQRWWDLRTLAWRNLLLGLTLIALGTVPGLVIEYALGAATIARWVDTLLSIASLPIFVLVVAGLRGDAEAKLVALYRHGWLRAVRAMVFAAALWVPLGWLHGMNHRWAMGAPDAQVWVLMALDSMVVGLMAMMAGTAIHHGCFPPPRERWVERALPAVS